MIVGILVLLVLSLLRNSGFPYLEHVIPFKQLTINTSTLEVCLSSINF
jgi:hypothetical protein